MSKLIILYGGLVGALFIVACSEDDASVANDPSAVIDPVGSLEARLGVDGGADGGEDGGADGEDGGADGEDGGDGGVTTSD